MRVFSSESFFPPLVASLTSGGYRELAAHGRKIIKEFLQRVTALNVVNKCLNRDSRSDEYRSAPKDVGIGVNNGRLLHAATSQNTTRILLRVPAHG